MFVYQRVTWTILDTLQKTEFLLLVHWLVEIPIDTKRLYRIKLAT